MKTPTCCFRHIAERAVGCVSKGTLHVALRGAGMRPSEAPDGSWWVIFEGALAEDGRKGEFVSEYFFFSSCSFVCVTHPSNFRPVPIGANIDV